VTSPLKHSLAGLKKATGQLESHWLRHCPNLDLWFVLILLGYLSLLLYRLAEPSGSLIFDECYYVQAARVLAGLPVNAEGLPEDWYSFGDPNAEHPPLAKLIMALGFAVFQQHEFAWRLPSVLFGMLSLMAVYGLVLRLGGSRAQGRFAVSVLAMDNLFFVHSRIATLDIFVVAFGLLGVLAYVSERHEISGVLLGTAILCKITGLFVFFGLVLWEVSLFLFSGLPRVLGWRSLLRTGLFMFSFAYFSLGALDCYYTEFRNPVDHVLHVFNFGSNLSRERGLDPQGIESTPLQWWLNEKSIDYLAVNTGSGDRVNSQVRFRGLMSLHLIAMAPFILAFSVSPSASNCRKLALLAACLFVASYVPILLTWLRYRRICYLYYMLPCLPPTAVGVSCVVTRLPAWVRYLFLGCVLYSLVVLFPFRV
jgi:predicted membrane-bound dolichyl-phosphate-mannose-protein mannosyltransferase